MFVLNYLQKISNKCESGIRARSIQIHKIINGSTVFFRNVGALLFSNVESSQALFIDNHSKRLSKLKLACDLILNRQYRFSNDLSIIMNEPVRCIDVTLVCNRFETKSNTNCSWKDDFVFVSGKMIPRSEYDMLFFLRLGELFASEDRNTRVNAFLGMSRLKNSLK